MATIKPTITDISVDGSVVQIQWAHLTNTDTVGAAVPMVEYADRSVQIAGTFGGSTTVIEGTNDETNYATLNNAQGTALSATAAILKQIVEVPKWLRPSLSGGAGADITVTIIARRANSLRN